MKLAKNTPEELVLDAKPTTLALFLGVFIFFWLYVSVKIIASGDASGWLFLSAVAVPLLFLTFAERKTITLNRAHGTITFQTRSVYKRKAIVHELFTVSRAQMRWNKARERGTLFIHCETGAVDSGIFHRHHLAKAASKAVNDWLKAYRLHAKTH